MAEDKKYNGWTNYETWCVKLWMDNEQGSSQSFASMAQDAYDNATAEENFTREERATLDLSDTLKEHYEEAMGEILTPSQSSSVWADLLGAALSEVNWHEIAEHLIDDVDKEESEDEDDEDDEDDESDAG